LKFINTSTDPPADLRYDHVLSVLVNSKCYLSRTKVHKLVTDSCSAEWQCFSCVVYILACLLTYLQADWYLEGSHELSSKPENIGC